MWIVSPVIAVAIALSLPLDSRAGANPDVRSTSDVERARSHLEQRHRVAAGGNARLELAAARVFYRAGRRRTVVRLQQRHRSIPINGAEAIVHLDAGEVRRVYSTMGVDLSRADAVPRVTRREAETVALRGARRGAGTSLRTRGSTHLEFVNPARLRGHGVESWRLAWRVEVSGSGADDVVWIDAVDGALLHRHPRIAHAFSIYLTDNAGNCPGSPSVTGYDEFSDYTNAPPDVAAAHGMLRASYSYFLDVLGLDGIHDASGTAHTVKAVVGECPDAFPNPAREAASWDGSAFTMRFGTGIAGVDDIVGHEYGHAVIDGSAALALTGQSGALAEAFADIFGEVVDLRQVTGNDAAGSRWAVGEDVPTGPFRSMSNPARHAQPEKMSDLARYYCGADADVAIHTNSGVLTHAFALLVDGGAFNGIAVPAVDIDKAARIFYRALRDHLTSAATFGDAYAGLLDAAADLVVEGALDPSDKTALTRALDAVELHTPPCSTQLPYCPAGSAPVMMFYDGFEDVARARWDNTVLAGVNHWNTGAGTPDIHHMEAIDPRPDNLNAPTTISVPHRGHYGLWADGARDSVAADRRRGDSAVAMQASIALPEEAVYFQYESRFEFQMWEAAGQPVGGPEPDGGVVEYSTDGVTWLDAGTFIEAGRGYTGAIQADYGNPLAGRSAFVGVASDYGSTRLNLASLRGQQVRFRFRAGTDSAGGDTGWFIDDVAIYSCTPSAFVVTPAAGLETAEDGAVAIFGVALAAPPKEPVVVIVSSGNPREGRVDPGFLLFDPQTWSVPQTITVTGVDDDVRDGAQTYSVTLEFSSTSGVAPQSSATYSVSITNRDNDTEPRGRSGGGGIELVFVLIGLLATMVTWRSTRQLEAGMRQY